MVIGAAGCHGKNVHLAVTLVRKSGGDCVTRQDNSLVGNHALERGVRSWSAILGLVQVRGAKCVEWVLGS